MRSRPFASTVCEKVKGRLRHASALLSGHRDLTVTRTTLQELAQKKSAARDKSAVRGTLRKFNRVARAEVASAAAQWSTLRNAMKILRNCAGEIGQGARSVAEWPSLKKRVKKAFRGLRRASSHAGRTQADADYHEWRKKAKRLFYELELAGPESGGKALRLKQVDELQETLGKYHDAAVVTARVRNIRPQGSTTHHALRLLNEEKACLRKRARRIEKKLS